MEVVLKMVFLSFTNIDIEFAELETLTWRSYTSAEALSIINQVKYIDKKKFAKIVLNENSETFVVYIVALEAKMSINPSLTAQIAILQQDKARTKVLIKYFDYTDIFLIELAMKLPENTDRNKHVIELIKRKQPFYGPIYALSQINLENLKAYIKSHLKIGFI